MVDNSIDGTANLVREKFPQVRVLTVPGRVWCPSSGKPGSARAKPRSWPSRRSTSCRRKDGVSGILTASSALGWALGNDHCDPRARLLDWAVYSVATVRTWCSAARGRHRDRGDNASYKRAAIEECPEARRNGFWKPRPCRAQARRAPALARSIHRRRVPELLRLWRVHAAAVPARDDLCSRSERPAAALGARAPLSALAGRSPANAHSHLPTGLHWTETPSRARRRAPHPDHVFSPLGPWARPSAICEAVGDDGPGPTGVGDRVLTGPLHEMPVCLATLTAQQRAKSRDIMVTVRIPEVPERVWASLPGAAFLRLESGAETRLLGEALRRTAGEIVAITEATCEVDKGWVSAIEKAHDAPDPVIGGAVEPDGLRTALDSAAFFAEYGHFMLPLAEGVSDGVPGITDLSIKRLALDGERVRQGRVWKAFWSAGSSSRVPLCGSGPLW